jgi:hypothetical protein
MVALATTDRPERAAELFNRGVEALAPGAFHAR